jgi:hypothetical protein
VSDADTYAIGNHKLPLWPEGQPVQALDSTIRFTRFDDWEALNAPLVKRITAEAERILATDPPDSKCLGGVKLFNLLNWDLPEYELIHARACEFYRRTLGTETAVVDHYWANLYRQWDAAGPHGHRRSTASLVYYVDIGEELADPLSGKFAFVDPRLDICCEDKKGYVTTPAFPPTENGTMLLFPSQLTHYVAPYGGTRPRITIAWNINTEPVPGDPAAHLGISEERYRGS